MRPIDSVRTAVAAVLAALAPASPTIAQNDAAAGDSAPVAIRAGRLIDVAAGAVRSDQIILIRGGTITAVGAATRVSVPTDARVIDLSGHTVLPGLIDTHTHITGDAHVRGYQRLGISTPRAAVAGTAYARETLRAGFTTVRDVGGHGFADVAVRDAIEAGEIPGPRMLVAGPPLGITGGHCDNNLLRPEFGFQQDGVADGADGVRIAVRRNVKYGVDLIKYCGTGVFLSMDIYNTDYTQAEGRKRGDLEEFIRKDAQIGETQRESFRKAVRAGARLTFGSDSGVYPHGDNAKQFAVMVRYGMTPMQTIQAATLEGAALLGLTARAGVIAAQAEADIIAVEGDPLADVRVLESVSFVMKRGEVYRGGAAACAAAGSPLGCEE